MLVTLSDLLKDADQYGYAVIAPDFPNIQVANAILDCAAVLKAPLALSFSPSLKPAIGMSDFAHFIRIIRELSSHVDIPVALHLDHAYLLEDIEEAINLGFTSVMIDASSEPWDINVTRTQEVVRLAHAVGVSVESELGHVASGGKYITDDKHRGLLTDPDQAAEFVELTGIDALAVAIGTIHGEYQGEPNLDFERLKKLESRVEVPLVLHGSSGTGEENLRKTIALGIRKINVYSDLMKALRFGISKAIMTEDASPSDISKSQDEAVKKILSEYLYLSGSVGAAGHWFESVKSRAQSLFTQGYSCAEAVYIAFAEKERFSSDLTQVYGTMFGGGICNQGGMCGAILGGLGVIAARKSSILPLRKAERKLARQAGIELIQYFSSIYGSNDCLKLTGVDFAVVEQVTRFRDENISEKVCMPAINTVVEWLENNYR